jgi:ComF family protein
MKKLNKVFNRILSYSCLLCGNISSRKQDLCQDCYQDLPWLKHACPRCSRHLPDQTGTTICGHCLKGPPPFEKTYALFSYQPPIIKLILELKFKHSLVNARVLGELLAEKIQHTWYQNIPLPHLIIPVPLHPDRLKQRGFNQAIEIARPIAKALKLPLNTQAERIKSTAAQATLHFSHRQQNIKNAFFFPQKLTNQSIAVIDDVITT